MTSLQFLKEIEKDSELPPGETVCDEWHYFLLRAFKEMREVAISIQDDPPEWIDDKFEKRMEQDA